MTFDTYKERLVVELMRQASITRKDAIKLVNFDIDLVVPAFMRIQAVKGVAAQLLKLRANRITASKVMKTDLEDRFMYGAGDLQVMK